MCGILCVFGTRKKLLQFGTLRHRGPDDTRVVHFGKCTMEFSRLAINSLSDDGMQPFVSESGALICNGEVYNHKELGTQSDQSDCACLLPLITERGFANAVLALDGEYALCYTDGTKVFAARDSYGVRPLFYTEFTDYDGQQGIAFASEVKALLQFESRVEIFPPGHWYSNGAFHKVQRDVTTESVKTSLDRAVLKRIENADRPIGFLLSGGLDSSLVVAIANKTLKKVRTFSIGVEGGDSPDLKAARVVSEHLGTEHTEVTFTVEQGISALEDVIRSLESYDTTTVRASVPMWLLARHISRHTDIKVLLSGEGSDELFGGYLYFHNAPSVDDLRDECSRRLRLIHQFDGLRADRWISAHGLELRVPFLDDTVVDSGMNIDQSEKLSGPDRIEKKHLRDLYQGYLPDEILYRQKNGMSDAVGYSWVDHVKQIAETLVTDEEFRGTKVTSGPVPQTKEEALYRRIFWKYFGHQDHLISEIWRPKWTDVMDPSARQLGVFKQE